ncbi:SDR family oxidoreductase [Sphingomonas sp. A2-49]|uniref:SDR family NAD(P)-dependent oxidoreductase n=1 Tax=Sphingomonas sp. A2-49 TaxID=1391375 RepID=UPI0021D0F609|nr:SDR family oxidoreductase [Sphingomonas sp. A2-49]MCU6453141.1 SDR family oxidoreductase [Sphingomonas sp. A2-49]
MSDLDFSGKTVLVVGGSSGIGNGIAQAFLTRGAVVCVTGTRGSPAEYDAADGSDLDGLDYQTLDLTDPLALDCWTPRFDALDVLVLCQGAVRYGRAEFELDVFREIVEINLSSVMACATRFHPLLAASVGSVIVISSIAAFGARIGNPAYAASKAAAVALVKTLAEAWAADGIRVNGIAPGLVPSKLTTITTGDEKRLASTLRRIPIGRLGTPDEIAGAALFLASPLASYVVGHTIVVDGGKSLS